MAEKIFKFLQDTIECYRDINHSEHANALPLFSDLLKEEYLWSEVYDEEEDFLRYEEDEDDVFPASLSYSFYFYSHQAIQAYRETLIQVTPDSFASQIAKL